jgi:3',5'-cyclic AMP phosphodiesterase CpdA
MPHGSNVRMLAGVALLAALAVADTGCNGNQPDRRSGEAAEADAPQRPVVEPSVVRRGGGAPARAGRQQRRRSLVYLAHITDPQVTDEISPARVGLGFVGTRRAHDPLTMQTFDQGVRSVNRRRTSRVAGAGGARARLAFALVTGDLTDNHQRNELRAAIRILDGGVVDPFSGKRLSARNRCPGVGRAVRRRLNRSVSRRRYTGVQDYRDWPGRPAAVYRRFWDPNRPPPGGGGRYAQAPRYPKLMDRAQRRFRAQGLAVPWFTVRGNHDALALGRFSAAHGFPFGMETGCRKPFPDGRRALEVPTLRLPRELRRRLRGAKRVPPDPARRFVSLKEFKRLHRGADRSHGFGFVARSELRRSGGAASYYAFSPRPGLRVIGLDTISDGGGWPGNLDRSQYRWLARELDRNSSRAISRRGRLVRDGNRDRLIVVFGHHPLDRMNSNSTDERLPRCTRRRRRQCDADPRRSGPMRRGTVGGRASVRGLLMRYPNVVLYLAGDNHQHTVTPYFRRDRRAGFWQITTSGYIDWPQEARLIDLMRNGDGTLSIFSTLLDHSAPATPPPSGTRAGGMTNADLASISRLLAGQVKGEPQPDVNRNQPPEEFLLRDPRRYW